MDMVEIYYHIVVWFQTWLEPKLETIYFISGIIIAATALYGIVQIRLLKKSIETSSKHATWEKAIEYSDRYLTSNRLLINKFIAKCKDNKIPYAYTGPIGHFMPNEIPEQFRAAHEKRLTFSDEWLPLLNDLEVISAAFASGVADEKLGFKCIGRSFCNDVIQLYDLIAESRIHKTMNYYDDIVTLYDAWIIKMVQENDNFEKKNISSRKKLLEKIVKTKESDLRAIGLK